MSHCISLCICRALLVPVFSFGENDVYKQFSNPEGSLLRKFQTKVKQMTTISPPLFHGRGKFQYTFGLVPFRKPVTSVGKLNNYYCHLPSFSKDYFSGGCMGKTYAYNLGWLFANYVTKCLSSHSH